MITLALYLLKVSLCSGLLYGYYYLWLRNQVFHQYNRFYLLGSVAASLLFPLVSLPAFLPEGAPTSSGNWQLLFAGGNQQAALKPETTPDLSTLLFCAYALTTLLFLFAVLKGVWKMSRLMQQEKAIRYKGVQVYLTTHAMAPFSYFKRLFWREDIDLDTPEGAAIFRHELAHIKAKHSVDKLVLQLVLSLCWINPFFWIIRRELQLIHEFVADQNAARNSDAGALARMILQTVYGNTYPSLINPFFQQPIKRRLSMLHKTLQTPRNAYVGRLLALPVAALILMLVAQKQAAASVQQTAALPTKGLSNTSDTVPARNADNIKEVRVTKKDNINRISITYKDGKEENFTEQEAREKGILTPPPPPPPMPATALVVVDGKLLGTLSATQKLENMVKPQEIASVNVWKNEEAVKRYGQEGKNGVIEITTLAKSKEPHLDASQTNRGPGTKQPLAEKGKIKDDSSKALLVIDGKEMGTMGDYPEASFPVKPENISSMNVLKDQTATDKYGEKGKYGVIEIITKKQ
ncbi:Signal transducer regulating beta-lactamase production, contains metallopeptidase domain [Cnuella takakiae]|uniref:Signal transducer regulating beta-lactamase production, contains metallopeptidase domain n=1 Tax=Cnuella takakiae TaxID=1302690 RepID=A0A1M4VZZ2_9BACT|nr:M56 family metallopeptidase [Cnuella takakiae]OLY92450.1 hypothetical protein BUE76_11545 [Cnuella takakiae]SHE74614.1 Signal transducer regulating beta-lactamase production, contains metallopeptidase domain [Cnuella takakiae]